MKHNVFVYGTLLSNSVNPAERMVDAEVIGPATIFGTIYNVSWFPGLKIPEVIDLMMGDQVKGELITVDQEGLERLDAYEGCPHLYSRVKTVAWDESLKDEVEAYTYVYNGEVHPDDAIPAGDFIAYSKGND